MGQYRFHGSHPVVSEIFLQTHFELIDPDSIEEIRSIDVSDPCPCSDGGSMALSTGARSSLR